MWYNVCKGKSKDEFDGDAQITQIELGLTQDNRVILDFCMDAKKSCFRAILTQLDAVQLYKGLGKLEFKDGDKEVCVQSDGSS